MYRDSSSDFSNNLYLNLCQWKYFTVKLSILFLTVQLTIISFWYKRSSSHLVKDLVVMKFISRNYLSEKLHKILENIRICNYLWPESSVGARITFWCKNLVSKPSWILIFPANVAVQQNARKHTCWHQKPQTRAPYLLFKLPKVASTKCMIII